MITNYRFLVTYPLKKVVIFYECSQFRKIYSVGMLKLTGKKKIRVISYDYNTSN